MSSIFIFVIGLSLIVLNFRIIGKEEKSFNKLLEREENNNNRDYDVEIINIRKDMAETVLELQKEIESLKEELNYIKKISIEYDNNKIDTLNDKKSIIDEGVISNINYSNKIHEKQEMFKSEKQKNVKKLLDKGLLDEAICEELSIGKGEILLIKSLLKN